MTETPTTPQPGKFKLPANIVSDVFSPLLMPTYAMIAAMWLTPLCLLPVGNRVSATAGIAFITCIIPLVFIFTMIRLGRVTDVSISDPRQRRAPYIVALLCYIGAAVFLASLKAPLWLVVFYGAGAIVLLLNLFITAKSKISAHTSAVGGTCALIFWLTLRGYLLFSPPHLGLGCLPDGRHHGLGAPLPLPSHPGPGGRRGSPELQRGVRCTLYSLKILIITRYDSCNQYSNGKYLRPSRGAQSRRFS